MKNFQFLAWILLGVFLSSPSLSYGNGEKIQVIASIFPVADMARQVGGNDVEVTTVVPRRQSAHI